MLLGINWSSSLCDMTFLRHEKCKNFLYLATLSIKYSVETLGPIQPQCCQGSSQTKNVTKFVMRSSWYCKRFTLDINGSHKCLQDAVKKCQTE